MYPPPKSTDIIRVEAEFRGVHLPARLVPPPPPVAPRLPDPDRIMRALRDMGPLIAAFAATTPVDVRWRHHHAAQWSRWERRAV